MMPGVASAAGGLLEVVENGVSGVLAPVGDVAAMAAAGVEILRDHALWERMSLDAHRLATERFGVARVVPQYEAFYQKVLMPSAPAAVPEPRD